jgi:hypothetical protein
MDEETLRERRSIVQSRGVARRYSYLIFVVIVVQHLKESSAYAAIYAPLTTVRVEMNLAPQMRSVRSSVFRTCQCIELVHQVGRISLNDIRHLSRSHQRYPQPGRLKFASEK